MRIQCSCYACGSVIAEIFPQYYDVQGHRVLKPYAQQRRAGFRPAFAMGRYLTQTLKHNCTDLADLRRFLSTCRVKNLYGPRDRDYWQLPEQFEQTRIGDCADFSIWTWRQLLRMGYAARFTGGKQGKLREGHAWVTFEKDGRSYLLEPQRWVLGLRMPRVYTLTYHPVMSVGWDGEKIVYYVHENRDTNPPLRMVPTLAGEWLSTWCRFWVRALPRVPGALYRRVLRGSATTAAATRASRGN